MMKDKTLIDNQWYQSNIELQVYLKYELIITNDTKFDFYGKRSTILSRILYKSSITNDDK